MISQGKYLKNIPPKSIITGYSGGGVSYVGNAAVTPFLGAIVLSGALTANTYKDILTLSGRGSLHIAYAYANDTTSRTIGMKIVVDGVTIFDAISGTLTAQYGGIIGAGCRGDNYIITPVNIPFNSSLVISVKSSIGETDKVTAGYDYELR